MKFLVFSALWATVGLLASHLALSSPQPSLTQQLKEKSEESDKKLPAEKKKIMDDATEALRKANIVQSALKVGTVLPPFKLPDATGKISTSSELLKTGPLIVTFYRGGWCPYCNLQLRAYQAALADFKKRNATLVAISPETPDNTLATSKKANLEFLVLSDASNAYAKSVGLVFKLPQNLIQTYKDFGIDLEKNQGNAEWSLPLPATFIVGQDGKILWTFIDVDYKKRADPADILAALDSHGKGTVAKSSK